MKFWDFFEAITRGNASLTMDVWCYAPYLVGWLVIVILFGFIMMALESAGLVEEETPEQEKESKKVVTFLIIVFSPAIMLAPIIAFAALVGAWWCYYIYGVLEPPEPIKRAVNHITFAILLIYTSLVLFGLVHQRPEFLLKLEWKYDEIEGFSERVEQNYPPAPEQLKSYLRSDVDNIRSNTLFLLKRRLNRKTDDPEIFDILFDRLENETNETAHETVRGILYEQHSRGWLTSKQTERLSQLKKAGAADRFTEPEDLLVPYETVIKTGAEESLTP